MTFLTFSFTSLLYYKNLVCNTRNIQDMCSLFTVLVRPPVNSKLLVLSFGGVKSYMWIFGSLGIGTPSPHHCSRVNCILSV